MANYRKPVANQDGGQIKRKLSAAERRTAYIEGAIRCFSEIGFDASTREIARFLGVTQPLLYKYFPSKEELINEVYRHVYLGRWGKNWASQLHNRAIPIRERLIDFYIDYYRSVFDRDWLRIYLFSALRGAKINKWYVEMLEAQVIRPIALELKRELISTEGQNASEAEVEAVWSLQSSVYYYGVRSLVYEVEPSVDVATMIANSVDSLMAVFPNLSSGREQT
ncbi:MAG: TetR/AcrR family transcriptional regulator [Rhizobiaceae bacterium]|nr:TetR/AcrR family transcriptional regulator [Rhizobiaceae bacterium]